MQKQHYINIIVNTYSIGTNGLQMYEKTKMLFIIRKYQMCYHKQRLIFGKSCGQQDCFNQNV